MYSFVLACDNKFAKYTYITMFSLVSNKRVADEYRVYVLVSEDFSQDEEKRLMSLTKGDVMVRIIRVSNGYSDECLENHLSLAAYNRLSAIDYVDADRCVYFDSDIIITGDIHELFEYDMEDKYLLGVKSISYHIDSGWHKYLQDMIGISEGESYINSGMLVMNLKKMREDLLNNKFKEVLKIPHHDADQFVLNYCCKDKIGYLPLKFNIFSQYYNKVDILKEIFGIDETTESYQNPLVIHYSEAKPWNNTSVPLASYWWNVVKNTDIYSDMCKEYLEFQIHPQFPRHKANVNMDAFLGFLRGQSVIVYGAGKVAKALINKMTIRGITPLGIAVSSVEDNPTECEGVAVRTIDYYQNVKRNSIVIIAVAETKQEEIASNLETLGFNYWKLYESWVWASA